MGQAEKELQRCIKIIKLQEDVVAMRSQMPLYEDFLKKRIKVFSENWVKQCRVNIEYPQIKIPVYECEEIDIDSLKIRPTLKVSDVKQQTDDLKQCFKFLNKPFETKLKDS